MQVSEIVTRRYEAPCGALVLGAFGDRLCLCDWLTERHHALVESRMRRMLQAQFARGQSEVTDMAARQLDEYFAGRRRHFDVPLLFAGTDFQKKVWKVLTAIPCGATLTYGELARQMDMPQAVRAVAAACAANAISIFTPCHRVIGSNGSPTGYAGGISAKKYLLDLEHSADTSK